MKHIRTLTGSNGTDKFCVAPFIHQYIGTDGKHKLCCAQRGDSKGEWNDSYYKEVRKKMLNNEPISECSECYEHESRGVTSHRQILEADGIDFIPDIETGNSTELPLTFDLRLNNICNLTCRMCSPVSSTQIEKHVKKNPSLLKYHGIPDEVERVTLDLREARKVSLLGGEPMLQPEAYNILEELDPSVEIFVTSNLTNLNTRFLNLLAKFKKVAIVWSIDGTEKTYEYIRHPARWKKIEKNLYNFRKLGYNNIKDSVQVTVSIYNVFDFWKVSNLAGPCDYVSVEGPEEMDISILPDKWREHALNEFYENWRGTENIYRSKLKSVLDRLENGKHNPEKMKALKARTELFDAAYGKSIYDYIPIFKEVFE